MLDDIVCELIVHRYDSMADMLSGCKYLLESCKDVTICKFKDRFANPTPGGWRDIVFNGYLSDKLDSHRTRHRWEIQFHLKPLLNIRSNSGGHALYGIFRSLVSQ